jgi:hypothetical protein
MSEWLQLIQIIVTPITVIASLIIGHHLGIRKHHQTSDRERKQRLYGRLMGLGYESYHLHRSLLETTVHVYFFNGILPTYNPLLQEGSLHAVTKANLLEEKESMQIQREDNRRLSFEILRKQRENGKDLSEIFGSILTLFPNEPELEEMIQRIFKYERLTIKEPKLSDKDKRDRLAVLTKWKEQQLKACLDDSVKYWKLIETLLLKIRSLK